MSGSAEQVATAMDDEKKAALKELAAGGRMTDLAHRTMALYDFISDSGVAEEVWFRDTKDFGHRITPFGNQVLALVAAE